VAAWSLPVLVRLTVLQAPSFSSVFLEARSHQFLPLSVAGG
jgi:hypothetical protein